MSYSVDATVGGKLAQLGARLIDGTAKKLAGEFFTNFSDIVSDSSSVDAKITKSENIQDIGRPEIGLGTWIGGVIILAAVVLAIVTG